ncbi:hypothetical protein F5146DRAFT_1130869 [Armillaria mellea]|nr:hypothetical protein F5146DRAFT_1130869 [Armillaria mellea]
MGSPSPSSTTPLSRVTQTQVHAGTSNQTISVSTNTTSTKVITNTSTPNTSLLSSSDPNDAGTISSPAWMIHITDTPYTSIGSPTSIMPPSPTSSNSPPNHVPQIIGGTLGPFLLIILLTAPVIFYCRRRLRPLSSQSLDIEELQADETTRLTEGMDQLMTRPVSHTSVLTSAYSPVSQQTFYFSYTDGFLRSPGSAPRHERDPSVVLSSASRLTAHQFLLHERAGSLRDEADALRQSISSTPPNNRIIEELQTTIRRLEEQVRRLEAEHESDWALYQLDEPPPVYIEA